MKDIISLYNEYLAQIGYKPQTILGGKTPENGEFITHDQMKCATDELASILKSKSHINDKIAFLSLLILLIIFVGCAFLIFRFQTSPHLLGIVFGGNFLSVIGIVSWIIKIWYKKAHLDIIVSILSTYPPNEAANLISVINNQVKA